MLLLSRDISISDRKMFGYHLRIWRKKEKYRVSFCGGSLNLHNRWKDSLTSCSTFIYPRSNLIKLPSWFIFRDKAFIRVTRLRYRFEKLLPPMKYRPYINPRWQCNIVKKDFSYLWNWQDFEFFRVCVYFTMSARKSRYWMETYEFQNSNF